MALQHLPGTVQLPPSHNRPAKRCSSRRKEAQTPPLSQPPSSSLFHRLNRPTWDGQKRKRPCKYCLGTVGRLIRPPRALHATSSSLPLPSVPHPTISDHIRPYPSKSDQLSVIRTNYHHKQTWTPSPSASPLAIGAPSQSVRPHPTISDHIRVNPTNYQ
jgi:hypothetical protein